MHIKSIKVKLSLAFGILLVFICVCFGIMSYSISSRIVKLNTDESLIQLAKEASKVVQARVNDKLNSLEVLAGIHLIKDDELTLNEKLDLLQTQLERSGCLMMGIADTYGKVKYTNGEVLDISDRDYFKEALEGKRVVSDPIISKINNDIILCYAVPIKDDNKIIGVLIAVYDGNELSIMTDDISFGKSGEAFMLNKEGIKVAHNNKELVMKKDNDFENVKNDFKLMSLVQLEKRMIQGEYGTGEYTYNGATKYMGFAPVESTNWSLAIIAPKSEVMAGTNKLITATFIMAIIFIGISIIITLLISSSISKPIKMASEHLSIVATGDFTMEVSEKMLNMSDETGILSNAINSMQQSVKNIAKKVVHVSNVLAQILADINADIQKLNKSIEGVSATTQQLSAESEETASATEEMNATSVEIEKAVKAIASKAQESAALASDIYKKAKRMKENAIASKENTIAIYERTKNSLENAIEQSKKVNQINELSEAILTITSQTSLLAINAAIESARAGEVGRGFAVVADEIRKLADDSKNTVTRIQEIAQIILEVVNNLSANSGEVLEFIDKKVLKDYEYLLNASEEYSKNSSNINDMVAELSDTVEELLASIQNMVKAIDNISQASSEGAKGASDIAQEVLTITQMSNDVNRLTNLAKEKSNILIKEVSQFKV